MKLFFVFCELLLLQAIFSRRTGDSSRLLFKNMLNLTHEDYDLEQMCTNLRFPTTEKRRIEEPTQCPSMMPGLAYIEHGSIKNFMYESFKDFGEHKFDKIFSFTCDPKSDPNTKRYRYYNQPSEIFEIDEMNQATTRERRILSVESIVKDMANQDKVPLLNIEENHFSGVPLFLFNRNSTATLGYLQITVSTHTVKLRNDIKPSEHVVKEYKRLPEDWRDDVNAYFKFIQRFGTHFRSTTKFGGSLFVLRPHGAVEKEVGMMNLNEEIAFKGVIREFIDMGLENGTKIVTHPIGGLVPFGSINEWIDSVHDNPVPIESEFIPINEFLDKSGTQKSKSLSEFIGFEEEYQLIKKYLYILNLTRRTDDLSDFVYKMLKANLNTICPSGFVKKVIDDGIINENNFQLNKFMFECTHKNNPAYKRDERKMYYNIRDICVPFDVRTEDCLNPSWNLPKGITCLMFFKDPSCRGKFTKIYHVNNIHHLLAKGQIKSYGFCRH